MNTGFAGIVVFLLSCSALASQEPPAISPTESMGVDELPVFPRWRWVDDEEVRHLQKLESKPNFTKSDAEQILRAFMLLDRSYGDTNYIYKIQERENDWGLWLRGCFPVAESPNSPDATVDKRSGMLSIPSSKIHLRPRDLVRFILEHRTKTR